MRSGVNFIVISLFALLRFFSSKKFKNSTLKYIEHAKTLNNQYAAIKQYAINDLLSQRKPTLEISQFTNNSPFNCLIN